MFLVTCVTGLEAKGSTLQVVVSPVSNIGVGLALVLLVTLLLATGSGPSSFLARFEPVFLGIMTSAGWWIVEFGTDSIALLLERVDLLVGMGVGLVRTVEEVLRDFLGLPFCFFTTSIDSDA